MSFMGLWKRDSMSLTNCPQCGQPLSEWFVTLDKALLKPRLVMWCYGHCKQLSPWATHREAAQAVEKETT